MTNIGRRGFVKGASLGALVFTVGGSQVIMVANEARAQPGNFANADSAAAYAAFAEKREPVFTGRWAVAPRSE